MSIVRREGKKEIGEQALYISPAQRRSVSASLTRLVSERRRRRRDVSICGQARAAGLTARFASDPKCFNDGSAHGIGNVDMAVQCYRGAPVGSARIGGWEARGDQLMPERGVLCALRSGSREKPSKLLLRRGSLSCRKGAVRGRRGSGEVGGATCV